MCLNYGFRKENPRTKILFIFLLKISFALKQLLIYELIGEEEEVGQWIMCLLNKHEYLCLDSPNPCEKPDMVTHISDLSPERDRQVPGTQWSKAQQMSIPGSEIFLFHNYFILCSHLFNVLDP